MRSPDDVDALSALAHETRLALYRILAAAGPDGLAANVVAERAKVATTLVSHHLIILARAQLLTQEKQGRFVIYRANHERMRQVAAMLLDATES